MFDRKKILYLAKFWLMALMLGISLVFPSDIISIEFGEVDEETQVVPILYDSPDVITGFHLFMTGMDIVDVYGGMSEANNFYLDQGSTCWRENECTDFITGNYIPQISTSIPSGTGVLLYVKYAEIGDEFDVNIIVGEETCLDVTEGFIIGPWVDGGLLVYDVDTGECMDSPIDCNGDYYGSDGAFDGCGFCDAYVENDCFDLTIDLMAGANLISFHALPQDNSLSSMFSSLGENINRIISEGEGAINIGGDWYGSLNEITSERGYWVIMETAESLIIPSSIPTHPFQDGFQYNLHSGNNLISYPFSIEQSIEDAISDEYLNSIFSIAGESVSAINLDGTWYGSLDTFQESRGYWFVTNMDIQFHYDYPD
ncbi:uncharacterized protein METZ01_LOCUS291879, partial [marine metagenome]